MRWPLLDVLERAHRQLGRVSRDAPSNATTARALNLLYALLDVIEVLLILFAHNLAPGSHQSGRCVETT